jgi:hypothetical protein
MKRKRLVQANNILCLEYILSICELCSEIIFYYDLTHTENQYPHY